MSRALSTRHLLGLFALCLLWSPAATAAQAESPALPTPAAHYEDFDLRAAGLALMPYVAPHLDFATIQRLSALSNGAGIGGAAPMSAAEIAALIDKIDLEPIRYQLIELLIHGSSVLDMVPEDFESWVPIVHDSFLAIMGGMDIDRIRGRVLDQASLPLDASRGDRVLAFGSETPIFQKMGQIIGRYSWVPEDLTVALVTLENEIVTTTADELVGIARQELGAERLREYDIEFEDAVLSEASVGAVIGATLILPGEQTRRPVVVKIIKEYAINAINEDLESTNLLLGVLQDNAEFYGIGGTPLVDMFREVRTALAQEVQAADERAHLTEAAAYFADDPRVLIPFLCPCSTANVTIMQRMDGGKVTDAYIDDQEKRTGLAKRLTDIMSYDVIFAPGDALFHGDPHAGNVFSTPSDNDPYRISLIDWGLQGTLTREQRIKFVQVGLGLQLKDAGRLRENLDTLVTGSIDLGTDRERVDGIIDRVFAEADRRKSEGAEPTTLSMLDRLVSELAIAGYVVESNLLLYVKSLATSTAVIYALDPEFSGGDYMSGQVTGQILKEMPKRLANTVWIPGMWSHEYTTMASNNDVWATGLNSAGLGFKAIGVGIWKGISFPFRLGGGDAEEAAADEAIQ